MSLKKSSMPLAFNSQYYAAVVKNQQLKATAQERDISYEEIKPVKQIVLVGDESIANEQVLLRYADKTYIDASQDIPKLNIDYKTCTANIHGKAIRVRVFIHHDYPMRNLEGWCRGASAVGIVVSSGQSKDASKKLIQRYLSLIGKKNLKVSVFYDTSEQGFMTTQEDVFTALKEGRREGVPVYETSAKEDVGVDQGFAYLIDDQQEQPFDELERENKIIEEKLAQLPTVYARMLLIGDASKTKENLFIRYSSDTFVDHATLYTDYTIKSETINGKIIRSRIGLLKDERMLCAEKHLKNTDAIGIVISSTQEKHASEALIEKYLKHAGHRKTVIFYDTSASNLSVETTEEDINKTLMHLGRTDVPMHITSVRTGSKGISEGFQFLAKHCLYNATTSALQKLDTILNNYESMIFAELCRLRVPVDRLNQGDNESWLESTYKEEKRDVVKTTIEQYQCLQQLKHLSQDTHKKTYEREADCANVIRANKYLLLKQNFLIRLWDWARAFFQKQGNYLNGFSKDCESFFQKKRRSTESVAREIAIFPEKSKSFYKQKDGSGDVYQTSLQNLYLN